MPREFPLPFRQIHLDFHTGPCIPDVGRDFDAREFARTMKRAHVNSVTVFAKCHHGHLYYRTRRPERHPGLRPGLDLLGLQIEALHREGIRAPIYLSVQCDEYAANTHPDWIALTPEGKHVGPPPLSPGWQILDLSSPYQEFFAEQLTEVLAEYRPVDGIFFDMCWDQPSVSRWAKAGMARAGLNPECEADRAAYARRVALSYMKRFRAQVKRSSPRGTVFFNCRPFFNLAQDIAFLDHVEIEALPTGGWGYIYFPRNVRHARTFPKPYLGMTARFHKSWADFGGLKPRAALEYETSQMIAHGARCSIGDQLHPRGVLDPAAYALIGAAYQRVAEREPWLHGARAVRQVGLLQLPTGILHTTQSTSGTDEGAVRMLTQLRQQFDVLGVDARFDGYDLIILPDAIALAPDLVGRVRRHLAAGGAILATGTSAFSADLRRCLVPEVGVKAAGPSPFTVTYLRFAGHVPADVPETDHVVYERGVRMTAQPGTRTIARVVEPYFERAWNHFSSHRQTPADKVTRLAAATIRGRAGCIAFPVFAAYAQHGNYPYRLLVREMLAHLLPDPLVRVDGPTGLETSLMRQGGRSILHLLYYSPERRAMNLDLIEDIVPLAGLNVSVRLPGRPDRVYLAPQREAIDFTWRAGRAELVLPELRGHAMVVFE